MPEMEKKFPAANKRAWLFGPGTIASRRYGVSVRISGKWSSWKLLSKIPRCGFATTPPQIAAHETKKKKL